MAEYTDRKELRMAMASVCSDPTCPMNIAAEIEQIIDCAPAADVAPVVRCKEFEHAELYERTDGTVGYYCGHPQNTFTYGERWDRAFKPAKEADDFCSYGERKDVDNAKG